MDAGTRVGAGGRNRLAAALTRGPVEVLDFVLPLWAGGVLGASAAQVGLLVALETLVSLLARPIAGHLADRTDRAGLAAVGAAGYGLSFAGYAVAPGLGLAFAAAAVGGAGGALFWVALRARVGEGLAGDSGAYSALFAAEGVGTWIAFAAGLSLVPIIDYRGVFALGAVACAVAAAVLLRERGATPVPDGGPVSAGGLGRRLRPMLALVAVTALAESGVALLLLLHLQRGHDLELGEIAAVFLPGFIVYSTLPDFLHRFVVRWGRTRVLVLALLCSAGFAAGLSFAPNPWVIGGMWILSAVAFAAAIPVEQAVIAEAAGGSLGRGMGIYETAMLLGATVGTATAGALYSAGDGWRYACLGAAALLLGGTVAVRPALRALGVVERPAPPGPGPGRPESGPGRQPKARPGRKPPRPRIGGWFRHVGIYVVVQAALAVAGYSWPVETVFGGPHDPGWFWNSSGHWLLNAGRLWTAVLVVDTVWTWGAVLLRRYSY
ncbi:putative MFS family arabinose efflux permease [Prauserella shujinwangii]|uniref:Putative MFS family arabinose efflux permease n=1 Tax=Prauserella shujinwangii TaxID=1453103 RepID=A0A2T0M0V2_9PSEU|nr:MFS transporter [Prauserella shujinwangii]PRX50211.1 putative MFS family arabinose efflux permease [Prauserella shujinwangii]